MTRSPKSLLLIEEIDLLVRHFGVERVRAALAKVSREGDERPTAASAGDAPRGSRRVRANGVGALESIRENQPEKYRLLGEFLLRLKDRRILPESQDIRHFAQIIGLKEIGGKSRENLIPALMRFLIERPIERLRVDIESASDISEQHRQMGFSVLTDKLLGR